ncbi:MAG: methyltransferase domain-containing protein [Pseudomonadota bacterium]
MTHAAEVSQGQRFEFGRNWQRFLAVLDERRIELATQALARMLGVQTLAGKTFLDVGSGSGLSSLAAWRLGASVLSFDYDPASVACTDELRRRFMAPPGLGFGQPGASPGTAGAQWRVHEGSVLDTSYLQRLGRFDVVYSWGVLHHTGAMWQALANVAPLVAPGGQLFVAIYNDQGAQSRRWRLVKRVYNQLPGPVKPVFGFGVMGLRDLRFLAGDLLRLKPHHYLRRWTGYAATSQRGMSRWHDWIDWVGGYPFEVARPEEIFRFYAERGFVLENLRTCGGGLGCNEYVFRKAGGVS